MSFPRTMKMTKLSRLSPALIRAAAGVGLGIGLLWQSLATSQTPAWLAENVPLDVDEIYQAFEPETEYRDITRGILFNLLRFHYTDVALDDEFSRNIYDRFLDTLDGSRSYFTAQDIARFEQYRDELDDMLQDGNLEAGYEIYNTFQHRVIERLVYSLKRLEEDETPFDFTIDEYLVVDRSEEPWAANDAALQDLWRKQLKSNMLGQIMDDKTETEARELLSKRFRSQLSNSLKTNGLDVYQRYMDAMTMAFDPHTQYYAPRAAENFNMNMRLSLEGIGAVLTTEDDYTKVNSVVTGGPADLAGELKAGDRIVSVAQGDNEFVDVIGWRVDDVVQLIRGEKGSVVRLTIMPESGLDTHIISITRDTVKLEDQSAKKEIIEVDRNGETLKIGVIELPTFYIDFEGQQRGNPVYKSSSRDVRNLLEELKLEDIDGVVMDLRGNGGGSLSEANALAGLFIRTGATVQVMDADGNNATQGDMDPDIVYDGPLVVLVDHLSASASEIFAGAIQDYQRGLVVGSQTFGKGTVQEILPLGQGQLKLTRAKFYRVSGESTQHKGVVPDITFPNLLDAAEELGESSLDNALPWDTIDPRYYRAYADLMPFIPSLRERHETRIDNDPDFTYIEAQIARAIENRDRNEIPLSREKLLEEQAENDAWRLQTENARRVAKGQEPYADIDELEGIDEDEEQINVRPVANNDGRIIVTDSDGEDEEAEPEAESTVALEETEEEDLDPYLRESGLIIGDLIELSLFNQVSLLAPQE